MTVLLQLKESEVRLPPIKDEHKRPSEYFTDLKWEEHKYEAPVVLPAWVIEKLKKLLVPVEWDDTQRYSNCPCCEWPMRYLTQYGGDRIITRLLPGSVIPIAEWLKK